jgi:hypothetical protein
MAFIFLDESGDLGFNPIKKNSEYFVITILATSNKKPIEKIAKKVHASLRKKVKKLGGGVLHAYKEKGSTKRRVLTQLNDKDCSIMTIYLNKSKVYTRLQEEKHVLYNYVTNILLDRIMCKKLIPKTENVTLVASKRETNKFLNENFKDYLKGQVSNKFKIKIEVEIKTPSEEKALQVVDFASWAIFRKYEKADNTYYDLIKKIIVEESPLFP